MPLVRCVRVRYNHQCQIRSRHPVHPTRPPVNRAHAHPQFSRKVAAVLPIATTLPQYNAYVLWDFACPPLSPHVDLPLMIASFGASAVLLFGVPASKLGQPRNFVGEPGKGKTGAEGVVKMKQLRDWTARVRQGKIWVR